MSQSQGPSPGKIVSDPGEIERELVRIWREAATVDTSKSNGEPVPRMRAVLSNLVIVTAHGVPGDLRDLLITELCITHPSRFFLVQLEPDGSGKGSTPLRTSVSSRCVLATSGTHVCSEEVYITAEFNAASRVPNLLMSLLVADVPVTLLVLCDPSALVSDASGETVRKAGEQAIRQLIAGLGKLCDRLVYDSSLFSHYCQDLEDLVFFGDLLSHDPVTGRAEAGVDVGGRNVVLLRDSNWQRLKRWRMYVAEQFSNKRFRDVDKKVASLEIQYRESAVAKGVIPSDAMLITAWFTGCLDWRLVEVASEAKKGLTTITYGTEDGASRKVQLRSVSEKSPEQLVSLRITLEKSEIDEIRIERRAGEDSFTISSGEFTERHALAMDEPFERLVLSDVISGRGDEDFARVLVDSLELGRQFGKRR